MKESLYEKLEELLETKIIKINTVKTDNNKDMNIKFQLHLMVI